MDQKRLKELMHYDPDTGVFTRKIATSRVKIGDVAGSISKTHGYVRLWCDGTLNYAHRLAWLYVHGSLPEHTDHINGIKHDNRIANLRSVTQAENNRNLSRRCSNKTGCTGVIWRPRIGKYCAYITVRTKQEYLGDHDHIFEAACARKAAEAHHGFHANHGRN